MKIIEKIAKRNADNHAHPIPKIVAFGDSNTQGCFEVFESDEGKVEVVYDSKNAYHAILSRLLGELFPRAAVTVVNAGISGDNTEGALKRLERDVLSEKPDLVIVSFGSNDSVVHGPDYVDTYTENLRKIFLSAKEIGSEVIFLTAPMGCTSVHYQVKGKTLRKIAADVAAVQNEGVKSLYFQRGKEAARECGAMICDVQAKWNRMAELGVDTDALLSNHINHPTREMTHMTARMLLDTMLSEVPNGI
jgi:hypothetical protein